MRMWIFVLMALVAFCSIGLAEGADWVVDDDNGTWADYETIQEAIDNASADDNITVYEGWYDEAVSVDVRVTITGNGSADVVVNGTGSGNVIDISAAGTEISGVNVTNAGTGGGDAGIRSLQDSIYIHDCILFDNPRYSIWSFLGDDLRIEDCTITNGWVGIGSGSNSGMSISGNQIRNMSNSAISQSNTDDCVVDNNTVINCTRGIMCDSGANDGLWENNTISDITTWGLHFSGCSDNVVRYNHIYDCDTTSIQMQSNSNRNTVHDNEVNGSGSGIYTWGSNSNTIRDNRIRDCWMAIQLYSMSNVTVTRNPLRDNQYGFYISSVSWTNISYVDIYGGAYGVWMRNTANLTISNCLIYEASRGIYLQDSSADDNVQYCRIINCSTAGVDNTGSGALTAENNWWNAADGPSGKGYGSGESVTTGVDFEPWYATNTTTPLNVNVTVSYNPVRAYSDTIQGGIDAANSTSTVQVFAGTYYENLILNVTGLTLIGNGTDATYVNGSGTGLTISVKNGSNLISGFNISGSGSGVTDAGIHYGDISSLEVDNCSLMWNENGVYGGDSYSIDVTSCYFGNNSRYGVHSWGDQYINISWCIFEGQGRSGVFLDSNTDDVVISNCTFENNNQGENEYHGGISGDYNDRVTVEDCHVGHNPKYGIHLDYADNCTVRNNEIVYNCGGVAGLSIYRSTSFQVYGNNISNSTGDGIEIYASSWLTIHNNTINGNNMQSLQSAGILGRAFTTHNLTIVDNVVNWNNGQGIYLHSSTTDCLISGNTILHSVNEGIRVVGGEGHQVVGNTVGYSDYEGIELNGVDLSTISDNDIFDSTFYGIALLSSSNVSVHHNNVVGNGGGSSQGYDSTVNNMWDDGTDEGNYWSDYGGSDTNKDGIGDTNYSITGTSVSDNYPLMVENGSYGLLPWVVDDDSGSWADFSSIQDAINASDDGRTIYVYAGNYSGDLLVNRSVTIIGNGSGESTIEGDNDGPTAELANVSIHLSGLGLTPGDSNQPVIDVWRNYIVIDNCSIFDFLGWGIRATDHLTIDNCTFDNGPVGITLNNDDHVTVKGCEMTNISSKDIEMYYCSYNTLSDNTLDWYGIEFSGSSANDFATHVIYNTTVNGVPIGYFKNLDNYTVTTGYSQVILANCQDMIVEDTSFSDLGIAVQILACDRVTITNSTFDLVETVVYVSRSDHCSVSNILATNVTDTALTMVYSSDSSVFNVTMSPDVSGTGTGLDFWSSSRIKAENSTLTGFQRGMFTWTTDNLTISNCTFADSSTGLFIRYTEDLLIDRCNLTESSSYAVRMENSVGTITNNSFSRGGSNCIRLQGCENMTVTYNEIFDNSGYGIYMWNSVNNSVHHNNFRDNGGALGQAFDNDGNNTWDDDVSEGNYWSDWGGNGTYEIGGSDAEDRYPLSAAVNTSAPEKIPEFAVVTVMAFVVFVFAAVFRRRRLH